MIEYKNSYQYFYKHLTIIIYNFSIDKFKNIFNTKLFQFLEDNKEYNQKTTCKISKNKYDQMINKLIKCICSYARLWIVFLAIILIIKKSNYLPNKLNNIAIVIV